MSPLCAHLHNLLGILMDIPDRCLKLQCSDEASNNYRFMTIVIMILYCTGEFED